MRPIIYACLLLLLILLFSALSLQNCQVQKGTDTTQVDAMTEDELGNGLVKIDEAQELPVGVDTVNNLAVDLPTASESIDEAFASGDANHNLGPVPDSNDTDSGLVDRGGSSSIEIVYPAEPAKVDLDLTLIDAMRLPEADSRRTLIGMWTQSGGSATPDFGPGGYSQSTLVFRTDGVLEIVRFYGNSSEVRIDTVLDYIVISDGIVALGNKPEFVRGASMPIVAGSWAATGPPRFPMTLRYIADQQTLMLDGKKYRHRSLGK